MLKNLPADFTRDHLVELLDKYGYSGKYDFVYVPRDFGTARTLSYAFVNIASTAYVSKFWATFEGFSEWETPSDEKCSLSWSDPQQGLVVHIERYRNSPVMHPTVPENWRPALFVNGIKVRFPAPTRKIKAPKFKPRSA
jgi:hypothetical protein